MTEQLSLFETPCLACDVPGAVVVLEAATFLDYEWTKPGVSVQTDCASCGSSVLTLRPQPSPWIEAVWGGQ